MPDPKQQTEPAATNGAAGESPAVANTAPDPPAGQEEADPGQTQPAHRQRVPLPKELKLAVKNAAIAIREQFPITAERSQANRTGRFFSRALCPAKGPGRPRESDVTRALRLEADGKSRKEIYRLLGKKTHEKQHALSEAMRQRKMREKRRADRDKSRPLIVTPTN